MTSHRANANLSVGTSAVVIFIACAIAGTVEIRALRIKDSTDLAPTKQDAAECVRCHADPKTIAMMRMKEGGANFLFNRDGTFKDPKFANLNGGYRHNEAVDTSIKAK